MCPSLEHIWYCYQIIQTIISNFIVTTIILYHCWKPVRCSIQKIVFYLVPNAHRQNHCTIHMVCVYRVRVNAYLWMVLYNMILEILVELTHIIEKFIYISYFIEDSLAFLSLQQIICNLFQYYLPPPIRSVVCQECINSLDCSYLFFLISALETDSPRKKENTVVGVKINIIAASPLAPAAGAHACGAWCAALPRFVALFGFAALPRRACGRRAAPAALDTRLCRASSPHLLALPWRACGAR